jgi:hypothetical protein
MNKYFKILVYVSFVFLAYYLFKLDYVQLSGLSFSWGYLAFSLVFLFLGFFWDAYCWWGVLRIHDINVTARVAITSHGMAIFAKYMPGKAWTVLGRAAYVATGRVSLVDLTFVSAKAQIILIFVGLFIGLVPYMIISDFSVLSYAALFVSSAILVFFCSSRIQRFLLGFLSRILKKDLGLHTLTLSQSYRIGMYYLLYWLLLMIGYYFLAASILDDSEAIIAFALPISTTIGVLAIITPGGLGVREGVMVGFLTLVSVPLKDALTLSILARFWFLLGELFIFILAVLFRIRKRGTGSVQTA